jgi:hypothetical protein
VIVMLFVLVGACASRIDEARDTFSYSHDCPASRLEARRRADIRPSDGSKRERPSTDVAADPERLQMWQQRQRRSREIDDERDEIYEVSGCGTVQLYACHRSKSGIYCSTFRLPDSSETGDAMDDELARELTKLDARGADL